MREFIVHIPKERIFGESKREKSFWERKKTNPYTEIKKVQWGTIPKEWANFSGNPYSSINEAVLAQKSRKGTVFEKENQGTKIEVVVQN